MKKLGAFIEEINEDNVSGNEKLGGYKDKRNGVAELNPKTDNDVEIFTPVVPGKMGRNERRVQERIQRRQPFFILGHAGWAKSSIVKKVAKRNGLKVLVVNLDKAVKEDLGGIPTPTKDSRGRDRVKTLPIDWMDTIIDNPDVEFLLFFDEMNQADEEVQNALMPIVQDHTLCGIENVDNYLPCGAGNYKTENDALRKMNRPLASRFRPFILWEDNTESAWKDTFDFYHEKYDDILGKEFINKFWQYHTLFECPRELNEKLWDQYIKLKKLGEKDRAYIDNEKPQYIAEYIIGGEDEETAQLSQLEEVFGHEGLLVSTIDRRDRIKAAKEMAQLIYDWLKSDGTGEGAAEENEGGKRRRKIGSDDGAGIDENMKKNILHGMQFGYIDGRGFGIKDSDVRYYVVAEENIFDIWDPADIPAESIAQCIKHIRQKEDIDFKYKTVKEAIAGVKAEHKTGAVYDPVTNTKV